MAVEGYDVVGRVICCLWDKVPIQRCLTEALLERVTPAAPEPGARFQPGDMVRLISGSPHMLVEGYDIAGRVICKYVDRGTPRQRCLTQAVLEIPSSDTEDA